MDKLLDFTWKATCDSRGRTHSPQERAIHSAGGDGRRIKEQGRGRHWAQDDQIFPQSS